MMRKKILLSLRRFAIFFFMLIPVATSTPVAAITNTQRKALDGGALYTNTEDGCFDSGTTTLNTGSGATGGVYLMGDSWLGGLSGSSPSISEALTTKGFTVTGVNSRSGRSITGVGTGHDGLAPQSGLEAADADAALIAAANKVVIVLGTNSSGYDSRIPDLIDKLQGKSVYWVNTSANFADIVNSTSDNNAAIIKHSTDSGKPYTVIDWFSKVYPGGDPTKIDVSATSSLMASDHIHPSDEGYKELVNLIVNSISTSTIKPVSGGCVCSVALATQLNGNDNYEKTWNYLANKGLTPNAIAGIMGNLHAESGINPQNMQAGTPNRVEPEMPTQLDSAGNPQPLNSIYGNYGYGIVQWTIRSRQLSFLYHSFGGGAAPFDKPRSTGDLSYQLDYMWFELESTTFDHVLAVLKNPNVTLNEASDYFAEEFEAPRSIGGIQAPKPPKPPETPDERAARIAQNAINKQTAFEKRRGFGADILAKYAGSSTSLSLNGATGCSTITPPGEDTKYVDGFTVYSQLDRTWKDKPYGSSTIELSGCGPAAMAMIITNLLGKSVTPAETTEYANTKNMYIENVGSSWTVAPVLAEHWGLKSSIITKDVASISAALQTGALIIGVGGGSKPFSDVGHYIVIRGVTSDGKFKISDSFYTDTSEQEWDPEQIVSQMHAGSIYAITK